jgi:hypothetical protein
MRRLLLATALACALLAPPAHAGPSFQIAGGADAVDGLVDPGGTLHVVWTDEVSPENNVVHYCRVPRGGTACTGARDVTLPLITDQVDEPYLVLGSGGSTLHIAMSRYNESDAYVWTSGDLGNSWSGATKVYDRGRCDGSTEPLLGPQAGQITFVAWNVGHCVFGAAINGSEAAATLDANPPGGGVYNFAAAPTGDGGLIAAADDLDRAFWWRLPPGADPSVTANWGAAQDLGEGEGTHVAGGAGGAYVLVQETLPSFDSLIRVRKWTGAGFAPPVDIGRGDTGYLHDLVVGPSGTVAAVWRRNSQNGESFNRLRVTRSTDGGASFSPPVSFATTEGVAFRLDVGVATDGRGFAVWQDEGETVRAASLEPIAEFIPTGGTSGGTSPGTTVPGGTTPRPAPARPLRRTVNVKGGSVTLTGPRGCVRRGGTFVATLKWKRKKRKGNLFVKVRRTDFYIGARRVKIDRRAPFRQTLRVRAIAVPGSTVRLRARAFIKVKRGRSPKKSLFVTFRVCA